MTQCNTLHVKVSSSQLNKLKSAVKNGTEVTLNISSTFIGSSHDETNFLRKLLLPNVQISEICKVLENGSSADIKLSKTQLHKEGISGEFVGRLLGPLLRNGLPLIGNLLKQLDKSVLLPLGLTAAASATDSAIQKKIHESGATILIISNKEIRLLIKGVSEKSINEKKRKGEFLGMLLDTLGAVLLVNLLASLVTGTNKNEDEELLKKEESTEILKILGLLINIETYEEI